MITTDSQTAVTDVDVWGWSCLVGLLRDHPVRRPRLLPLHVADEVLGRRQVLPLGGRVLPGPERHVTGYWQGWTKETSLEKLWLLYVQLIHGLSWAKIRFIPTRNCQIGLFCPPLNIISVCTVFGQDGPNDLVWSKSKSYGPSSSKKHYSDMQWHSRGLAKVSLKLAVTIRIQRLPV